MGILAMPHLSITKASPACRTGLPRKEAQEMVRAGTCAGDILWGRGRGLAQWGVDDGH